MGNTIRTLTVLAVLGAGVMAGVFYAFSAFVMDGLRRLPAPQGVAAMQQLNVSAPRPPLMTALAGTAVLAVAVVVLAAVHGGWDRRTWLLLAAGAAYLLAAVVLTGGYHVPRNDALAALDPAAPATA